MTRRPTILVWHPGSPYATGDVARGLVVGLRAHGARVVEYHQSGRFAESSRYLADLTKRRRKAGVPLPAVPTYREIARHASAGILETAFRCDPDWVIAVNGGYQDPTFLTYLRRLWPVALLATEAPYQVAGELHLARHVDHVFTNERSTVGLYRLVNPSTSYLPAAWDPQVHGPAAERKRAALIGDTVPSHDVVFCGTAFEERIAWLEAIDWTGIDVGIYGDFRRHVGSRSRLRPFLRGGTTIPNAGAAALYSRARVGLNLHRSAVDLVRDSVHVRRAESANPRAYELAACGVAVVSDYRPEVAELYGAAGAPYVCRTPDEMGAAVRRLLADDGRRVAWAAAAHAAVSQESWIERSATVLETLMGGVEHAGVNGGAALATDPIGERDRVGVGDVAP